MEPDDLIWLRRFGRRPYVPAPLWPVVEWKTQGELISHDVPPGLRAAFIAAGYRERDFFAHRIRYLPKVGPDGSFLSRRMAGVLAPQFIWQVVLHATSPAIDEFPHDIFFDRDLIWHQQHFHEPGQVASATMAEQDSVLYTMAHQSDLVQRISRRRDLKTRVEKVFAGWHHLLLNAIVNFAFMRGCRELRVPTSRLMMRFTDRKRTVQAPLFERVYDRAVQHHFAARESEGWWCIDVRANRSRFVVPERHVQACTRPRTICLIHDVERGLGHVETDPAFAREADQTSDAALTAMLDAERAAGVRATYNVVGTLLPGVRGRIELRNGRWHGTQAGGHALAFHSYDHASGVDQLQRCRGVDYRLKGYRVPRSRLTAELTIEKLCWHNFEWLSSSAGSLAFDGPLLDTRVAKIPVFEDDFPLHRRAMDFDSWKDLMFSRASTADFVAIGLHDCYGQYWLSRYPQLLEGFQERGTIRTFDEVADELYLAAAI